MSFEHIEQRAEELRILGLVVSQHGKTVYEHDWDGPCRRNVYSASKSYTSCAVGMAIEENLLGLDERLTDLFPDEMPAHPDENLQKATLRDCLTMCLGQAKPFLMGEQRVWMEEDDWAKASLAVPFEYEPNTHFVYNNAGPYLAGLAVQKRAGCSLVDYLMPRLFAPLGTKLPTWEVDPMGRTFGAGGLFIALPDLHKLGLLYQQEGTWNGKQLVPASWVAESTRKQVENGEDGYGYLFWRGKYNSYRADGKYGQYSIVVPEKEAVISAVAENRHQSELLKFLLDEIVPEME